MPSAFAGDIQVCWVESRTMATTSYITTHGRIRGEVTNGVMTRYGTDASGSVVATYSGGSLQNTYRYKPYGSTLIKTGSATDPSFLWNGEHGYRATTLPYCDYYVRMRHFGSAASSWTTVDPYWPKESPYGYAEGNPVSRMDSTGGSPCPSGVDPTKKCFNKSTELVTCTLTPVGPPVFCCATPIDNSLGCCGYLCQRFDCICRNPVLNQIGFSYSAGMYVASYGPKSLDKSSYCYNGNVCLKPVSYQQD
jgi:RHS repeat-associated protein